MHARLGLLWASNVKLRCVESASCQVSALAVADTVRAHDAPRWDMRIATSSIYLICWTHDHLNA